MLWVRLSVTCREVELPHPIVEKNLTIKDRLYFNQRRLSITRLTVPAFTPSEYTIV